MNGVLIIPTGIGAAIGGHAGDANPVCKLLASCCDTLITHPNVVNASDINEMPENVLYVEGSQLDRFLSGEINLEPVKTYNKILLACNPPISNQTINAVNAAMVTVGADIKIIELDKPLIMKAFYKDGKACGDVEFWEQVVETIQNYNYDALAIHTSIDVDRIVALNYFKNGGVNPWGYVEAKASKLIANAINKPVAHAPLENMDPGDALEIINSVVDPRMAPEVISNCYLHCVLKGLHRAPKIGDKGINIHEIDFMVSPIDCWGPPHDACYKANIPIIFVRENTTKCPVNIGMPENAIFVENYWEAAGYVIAMSAGVNPISLRLINER